MKGKSLTQSIRKWYNVKTLAKAIATVTPAFTQAIAPFAQVALAEENNKYADYKFDERGFLVGPKTLIDIRDFLEGKPGKIREWPKKIHPTGPISTSKFKELAWAVPFYRTGLIIDDLSEFKYLEREDWGLPTEKDWKSILEPEGISPHLIYPDLWDSWSNFGFAYWSSEGCEKTKEGNIICREPSPETEKFASLYYGAITNINPRDDKNWAFVYPVHYVDGDDLPDSLFSIDKKKIN